jgi:hypothetical protein
MSGLRFGKRRSYDGGIPKMTGSFGLGRFVMKKFMIAAIGVALAFGPALYAQDVVTGVKDLGKDVDKGGQGHRQGR